MLSFTNPSIISHALGGCSVDAPLGVAKALRRRLGIAGLGSLESLLGNGLHLGANGLVALPADFVLSVPLDL